MIGNRNRKNSVLLGIAAIAIVNLLGVRFGFLGCGPNLALAFEEDGGSAALAEIDKAVLTGEEDRGGGGKLRGSGGRRGGGEGELKRERGGNPLNASKMNWCLYLNRQEEKEASRK